MVTYDIIEAVQELKNIGAKKIIIKSGEDGIYIASESEFISSISYSVYPYLSRENTNRNLRRVCYCKSYP